MSNDRCSTAPPPSFRGARISLKVKRLWRALVAGYGVEVGNDACAEALAYAWEHWERVRSLDNPVGYRYRVAQSSTRRHRRWSRQVVLPLERPPATGPLDPELSSALGRLTQRQRQCVVLVHVYLDGMMQLDVYVRDTALSACERPGAVHLDTRSNSEQRAAVSRMDDAVSQRADGNGTTATMTVIVAEGAAGSNR